MNKNSRNNEPIHIPIMVREIMAAFRVSPGKTYIDGTFGFGGHTQAILQSGGTVIAIERDEETIREAQQRLQLTAEEQDRLKIAHTSFHHLKEVALKHKIYEVDGILLDLGYSSWHLDKSKRGFRFSGDERLDMRYEPTIQQTTAYDILNKSSEDHLEDIIGVYAEEEEARKIARAIRKSRPITTNTELVRTIEESIGKNRRRHARIFQAIRIAVNNELSILKHALPHAAELLQPGGVLAILSFHSLEDRIVKQFMNERQVSGGYQMDPKKPITAQFAERKRNPRSRSAKLRLLRKL